MNNWNIPELLEKEVIARDKACVYCGVEFVSSKKSRKTQASREHIFTVMRAVYIIIIVCIMSCGGDPVAYKNSTGDGEKTPAETISTPNMPFGYTQLIPGINAIYTTDGATSNLGHSLDYRFQFGSSYMSDWSQQRSASHVWHVGDSFVRSQARCAVDTNTVSGWSDSLAVTVSPGYIFFDIPSFRFENETDWLHLMYSGPPVAIDSIRFEMWITGNSGTRECCCPMEGADNPMGIAARAEKLGSDNFFSGSACQIVKPPDSIMVTIPVLPISPGNWDSLVTGDVIKVSMEATSNNFCRTGHCDLWWELYDIDGKVYDINLLFFIAQ